MKLSKKLTVAFAIAVTVTLTVPTISPIINPIVAEAATVKMNKKSLSLTVGKTATLKITGTKKAIKWTTSKKSVATVSSKGKVKAIKAGTATITATVNKKKYTCKVTVKQAVNPIVKNAPFEARETSISGSGITAKFVVPKSYKNGSIDGLYIFGGDTEETSKAQIGILISPTNQAPLDKDTLEIYGQTLDTQLGSLENTANYKRTFIKGKNGPIIAATIDVTQDGVTYKQGIYVGSINNFLIQITTNEVSDANLKVSHADIAKYIIDTITVKMQ